MTVAQFADQSCRFDGRYGGSYIPGFPARGVLHSTETLGLPGYDGGATAPQFTVRLGARNGKIWQHYDSGRPGRALKHPAGTIDTNNAGARQIEVIGYSDRTIAKRVGGISIIDVPAADLAPLIELMRWLEKVDGIERTSGLRFEPYPDSAGLSNGVRMTTAQWRAFRGWCGHEHVPVNDHGDPSSIAIATLIGKTTATEDDVDPNDFWKADIIEAPDRVSTKKTNPTWQARTYIHYIGEWVLSTNDNVMALRGQVQELTKEVAALKGLDPAAVAKEVGDAIRAELADLKVTLTNDAEAGV